MKATELIIELQKLVEKHGDLDVRAFTEQGQGDMKITSASVRYAYSEEWMIDWSCPSILDYVLEEGQDPNYTFFSLYAG